MKYGPRDLWSDWQIILTKCLTDAVRKPSEMTITLLFLAPKVLLAAPRRGGRSRMDAVSRKLWQHFSL